MHFGEATRSAKAIHGEEMLNLMRHLIYSDLYYYYYSTSLKAQGLIRILPEGTPGEKYQWYYTENILLLSSFLK